MAELKRIDILSFAKFQAVLMALIGLIVGVLYAIFTAILGSMMHGYMGAGISFGYMSIISLPILYALFGFLGGAIIAFLYNVVARWIGGIELDLK